MFRIAEYLPDDLPRTPDSEDGNAPEDGHEPAGREAAGYARTPKTAAAGCQAADSLLEAPLKLPELGYAVKRPGGNKNPTSS